MPPEEIARLGEVKLIPGMPVEAFVQTGDRTMLSYLIKPLHDQLMRAFREKFGPVAGTRLWPPTSTSRPARPQCLDRRRQCARSLVSMTTSSGTAFAAGPWKMR